MKNVKNRFLKPKASIQVNVYAVLSRAVEEGINYGWHRAHKHTNSPDKNHVMNEINMAVMNSISDIILWPDT